MSGLAGDRLNSQFLGHSEPTMEWKHGLDKTKDRFIKPRRKKPPHVMNLCYFTNRPPAI